MPASAAKCSDEAFAFIDGLDQITTAGQVIDAMMRSLSKFGIDYFIVTGLPNYDERFEQGVVLRKWPLGWFELYAREEYVHVDPVIRRCRGTVRPFEWTEAPYDPKRERRAREVMDRAADFGMPRGFSVPVHGLHGQTTCFSMSGSHPGLSSRAKPALHLMAVYAFERIRQIAHPDRRARSNPLTDREREVLCWAAAGRSATEISAMLQITERTVTAHTVNAMRKLKASNKTQAVASAMHQGLIRL